MDRPYATTIRNHHTKPPYGNPPLYSQFAIVFIIQTYAFTLTLRRKNLISHKHTIFIYAYQLSIGGAVAQIEIFQAGGFQALAMFPALAAAAMLLRIGAGLNKYLVWLVMSVVVQYARRTTVIVPPADRLPVPEWFWPTVAALMLSASFGLFAVRSAQRRAAAAAAAAAAGGGEGKAIEASSEKDAKLVQGG